MSDAPKPNDAHGIDLRREGLTTPDAFAADSRLVVWRDIPERRNATLDLADRTRLHVKLIRPPHGRRDVSREVGGIRLLERAGIATVPLVSHGVIKDGGGVIVTRDLAGFVPADALLKRGAAFADLREQTAAVAARLHAAGLHHRDLYPCHFLISDAGDVRLIDAARVRRMPWLTRRRWLVKDLAQFRYGATRAGAADAELDAWLARWAELFGLPPRRLDALRRGVVAKAERIARHDARLRERAPERDVSLRG